MKKSLLVILLLFLCVGIFACNEDNTDNNINEELIALNNHKANCISELNQYILEIDESLYTEENWNHIQTLLLTTINNINSASSEQEVSNYVANLKTTISLVSKKDIISEPVEVSEEVWEIIEEDLVNAFAYISTNDYEASMYINGNMNTNNSGIVIPVNALNSVINLKYISKVSSYDSYLEFSNKEESIKVWLLNSLSDFKSDVYIAENISSDDAKHHIDLSSLISFENGEIPTNEEMLYALLFSLFGSQSGEMPALNDHKEIVKEFMASLENSISSSMITKNDETIVTISTNIKDFLENNPEIGDYFVADTELFESAIITIVIEKNNVTSICIEPENNEDGNIITIELSKGKLLKVSFETLQAQSEIEIKITIGFKFVYEFIEIPDFNPEEFIDLDISEILKDIDNIDEILNQFNNIPNDETLSDIIIGIN